MKKNNKSGVSMIILVITIIVMIILATAGIAISSTIITNSKKTAFAEDLQAIQDAVTEYYVNNNVLPTFVNNNVPVQYTKAQFIGQQTEGNKTLLESELVFNSDESADNIFYVIDMAKIDVKSSSRGLGGLETPEDVYLVSKDTKTVYYYQGYNINGEAYYSITDRLIDIDKPLATATSDTSTTSVSNFGNIKIKKNTELITNSLTLEITGTLEAGETLKYNYGSTSSTGAYSIASLPAYINTTPVDITGDKITNFLNNPIIGIIKTGATTQTVSIDASNLDITIPPVPTSSINRAPTEFNYLTISPVDNATKVYYEYVTKIDETNAEVGYYDIQPTITEEYLKSFGKTGTSIVKLAKDVQSITVILVEESGNVSPLTTIDNISID